MPRRPLIAGLIAVALATSACGGLSSSSGGEDQSPYPTGSNQLVLRVDTCCGFIAPETTLRQIPWFSLFGDGRITTLGAQIEIYPGPALPSIVQTDVTDEAIRKILDAARDAGLYEDHDRRGPGTIADAGTTIFTLVEGDGTTHVTRAYALGESNDAGLSKEERDARERLQHFWNKLGSLRDWLPQGSVGEDTQYRMNALRVYARPYTSQDADPGLEQPAKDWPLSEPLATFGEPVQDQPGLRCGVVEGQNLDALRPEVERSNELTPWLSEGHRYRLFLRPLLPDESGCQAP